MGSVDIICSGDPDGSYSEWSWWVDILQVYGYFTSTRRMPRALPVGSGGWCRSRNKDMYSDSQYGTEWQEQQGPTIPKRARSWLGKSHLSQYLGSRWWCA
ncbi:hypothetical protein TIFTF001_017429 [Ficus carica]|uniref:Uncharacterized protein n=1 Tax=Ficus carica TaxID=3494 RepID=A0AA88A9I2_FICCA|nr:hypothetical protein TIFTF001_017429 [Ficus carica]